MTLDELLVPSTLCDACGAAFNVVLSLENGDPRCEACVAGQALYHAATERLETQVLGVLHEWLEHWGPVLEKMDTPGAIHQVLTDVAQRGLGEGVGRESEV